MIIADNGERRRWALYTFGGALIAAVGTKVGEWLVEEIKRRYGRKEKQ